MNKFYVRLVSGAIVIIIIGALLSIASPVFAQEPSPTPIAEATATPAPDPQKQPNARVQEVLALELLPLVTTVLMWILLFRYTYMMQDRYYTAAEKLAKSGFSTVPTVIGTETFHGEVVGAEGVTPEFKIDGPKIVTVGVESGEYKLISDSQPAEVKWSVEPANAAAANPITGSSTKIVAAISGAFHLKADVKVNAADPTTITGMFSVAAIAPQAGRKIDLPVFGRGYGTIAIAIVILAIVLIMGLSHDLDSAAIATLLGALVGYIFSKGSSIPPTSSSTTQPANEED